MKALKCEMCGSTELIKKDGVYVRQHCGVQYTVEEAKKMMVEGTVDVKGTVKVDTSDELKNLYEIARRAKDSDNNENAAKYYDMILVKDPQSWEANFYVVYFKAMSCKIAEIWSAANSLYNCIEPVMELVNNNVTNEEERASVIEELKLRLSIAAKMLSGAAKNSYEETDEEIKNDYIQEYINNAFECAKILYLFGDALEIYFESEYGNDAAYSWKGAIEIHNEFLQYLADKESNKNQMKEYADKIHKYDKSYQLPEFKTSSGGCYIATAVYGSYDCPQVWTLRRFRDFTLAQSWYGRGFIKTYYAISPTLVKVFGNTRLFQSLGRALLDKKVNNLNAQGVENTPYNDKH